jgi:sodium/potassium/calcium exchanger 3
VNEGGVGTIVGSAIFNILMIVGITCVAACQEQDLPIWWYPLSRDCAFYIVSVLELVLFLADEEVKWWEASIMVLTYICYCVYMKFNPRIVEYLGIDVAVVIAPLMSL